MCSGERFSFCSTGVVCVFECFSTSVSLSDTALASTKMADQVRQNSQESCTVSQSAGPPSPSRKNSSFNSMEQLMQGPLVAWVRTFREENGTLDYADLINGAFLDDVLSRIDPRASGTRAIQPAEDVCTRIRNFDNLVRSIKSFYEDVLGQLILVRLPDPVTLGRDPDSEMSLAGMQMLLLLVLGCAVQGPSKEAIIEDIKKLPFSTQHAIVECIQQVADNPACVWSKEWSELTSIAEDQQESLYRILVAHVRRLVGERDEYAHQVAALVLRETASGGSSNTSNANSCGNGDRHHSVVELAEAKARIRRWRQEVEEKCEQVAELREELDEVKTQLAKVKQENMELVQEARLSKALRDELDIVRERATKVDRLEAELNRYKDKLNDIDYYKARLEELREDNRLLEETKSILEGQLESARQRAELVLELEGQLLNYKSQLNNMLAEKDADKERIKKLIEENAHWQLCTKNCLSESASLVAELDSIRAHQTDPNKSADSLGEQITALQGVDLLSKTRRLEMENQRLVALLSNMKEAHFRENAERILHLEGENTRLKLKMEELEREQRGKDMKISEMINTSASKTAEVEKQKDELERINQELKNNIESLKIDRCKMEEYELQLVSANSENQKLQRSADLFQKRFDALQTESTALEVENSKLQKTVDSLRNSLRRLNELEKENTDLETDNHRIDRESKGLHKEIARLKQAIEVKDGHLDEFSSKVSTLEREHKRLTKECEQLQNQGQKLRELERENKDLQQATSVERKTLSAIREELVQEKIRCQQLQCQLETNSRTLDHVREECHSLKIKSEEMVRGPETVNNSKAADATVQPVVIPTLELGREVLAIKDRLVELERENAVLSAENGHFRSQVSAHKEQVTNSQSQLAAISQQLATLQVENSTLSSQLNSVSAQNSSLQTTLTQVEAERESYVQQLQTSQSRLEQLSRDQEELQKLHEQLQSEYDALLNERESLKASQRELKLEVRSLNEKLDSAATAEEEWKKTQETVQEELEKLRTEARSLSNLRAEHSRLKDDFRSLFVANEKLKNEYKNLQGDYKTMRGEHNALKLKQTQLQGEMAETRHQMTNMDVELGKVNNKCEVLQQWNNTLEEDKRNLVNQVSVLLTQYHELLSQTLEEKDHFHEETKNFSDKLNHLKRQKEILEDKIMEQYRRMENSTPLKKNSKSSSIGALFVRKMRRASSELINRVPRSRSRSRGPLGSDRDSPDQQDGQDAFSLESGSHSGSNSGCGSLDGGSGGEGDVTPTGVVGAGRSERDRIRQSMPIINFEPHDNASVMRNSFSSDTLSLSSDVASRERNANTNANAISNANSVNSVISNNQQPSHMNNGNSSPQSQPSVNGNGISPAGTPTTSTTTGTDSLNSSLITNSSSSTTTTMMMNSSLNNANTSAACTNTNSGGSGTSNALRETLNLWNTSHLNASIGSLHSTVSLPAKQLKLNGLDRSSVDGSTLSLQPINNSSPIPALKRINHGPSRVLGLLERAGSRQPVCISELDPSVLDPTDEEDPDGVPTRDFCPHSSALALSSSLLTPNRKSSLASDSPRATPRNLSPASSDISESGSVRTTKMVARVAPAAVQTSGTSPPPPAHSAGTPNGPKLVPSLTSTTRINVNISSTAGSSPNSPLSGLERRGSLRLPPRPANRPPLLPPSDGLSGATPPLPARSSNLDRPALPPRQPPSGSSLDDKPMAPATVADNVDPLASASGASSIWYEYGCV